MQDLNTRATPATVGQSESLIPARMVNEYVYCPRLAYLEWVQGEWEESVDTVQGRHGHRRVDRATTALPPPDALRPEEPIHARSVTLSSDRLGVIAKMDLIEAKGGQVIPVDYKKGKRPHIAKGAYEPERVQLAVQGLLLREHGYDCTGGALYFLESRERVPVDFDEALIAETRAAIEGLRLAAQSGRIPPPLDASPKCPRCSLVGICLPDEVNYLTCANQAPRPVSVRDERALPLYVQARGAKLSKSGENLVVTVEGEKTATTRLVDTSQVVVMGNVYITSPCLQTLMQRGIPVTWHSFGGWFYGHTVGNGHKNVELRTAQYAGSFAPERCLAVARDLVAAKIGNCRVLMRRNWKASSASKPIIDDLRVDAANAAAAESIEQLLGIEGAAAARYFGSFNAMLSGEADDQLGFHFTNRNRRPPKDPINALLSFAYSLLTRTVTVTLSGAGFDPFRGFYHQPRHGRPALALDLMEPFRPILADSVVLQVVNNQEIRPSDFLHRNGGVSLEARGRKRLIAAFERRLDTETVHPAFGYRVNYRRLLAIQARLFGRYLTGEIPHYPNFQVR